ncbi:MAG TPA: hypothetical protein HA349_10785 [Methanotrichaceae archaeon]|nr:hypothetical protein [Methanotrichaceae archaeon]
MKFDMNPAKRESLDSLLKEASEGYGDLVATSMVHKVSLIALRSRLRELQLEKKRAERGS